MPGHTRVEKDKAAKKKKAAMTAVKKRKAAITAVKKTAKKKTTRA